MATMKNPETGETIEMSTEELMQAKRCITENPW